MTLLVCKPYRLGEGPPASNRPPPRTSIQHGRGPRGSLTPYNGAPPANVPPQPTIKRHAPRRQLHISARHPTQARRPPTILPQHPPKKPISTPTTTPPRPTGHHPIAVPWPPRRTGESRYPQRRGEGPSPAPPVLPAKAGIQRGAVRGRPSSPAPSVLPAKAGIQRGAARGRPSSPAPSVLPAKAGIQRGAAGGIPNYQQTPYSQP